jgi:restriction endonuclease
MADTPAKWKVVENVVAAFERSLIAIVGTKVIPNSSVPERVSGTRRQVDVYIEIPTGNRILRIGVEVRNECVPLDLVQVEQLVAKLGKLDIDRGCIVSTSGFTASGKEEAGRNGVELRTVTEIENPDWWLASTMRLELDKIELLHFQVNFRPDEIRSATEMLSGIGSAEVKLTLPTGESGSLQAFVVAQGPVAAERPEFVQLQLKDQDQFSVTIDFSQLNGASLKCSRGPLPMPQSINAIYRIHRRIESVKLSAYEGTQGVNAFTGVSNGWGKQLTLVAKLQQDGSRSLSFTLDEVKPKKTKIDVRRNSAEIG